MKRLLSCLLCAALLLSLSSCALVQSLTGQASQDPADSAGWHKPTVPGGSRPDNEPDNPDQPSEAPTEPIPMETTASGAGIITDYSGYGPRPSLPEANYTRLRDEPIPDLEPGNYGPIFPFAAESLYSNSEDGYSWQSGRYYGFVTADGKIVCDPTYIDTSAVFYYNYEVSETAILPLWTFMRTANIREEHYEEDSWLTADGLYGVAAIDGSWVLPCQFLTVQGTTEGFIGIRSWDHPDFDVYDLDGNRLFGTQELSELFDLGDNCYISFSEGIYVVCADERYYAVDHNGALLFGPMNYLGGFSGGIAPASENGMYFGYVDQSGSWALQPFYDGAEAFRGDYAIVTTGRGPAIIDRMGNYTLSTDGDGYLSWAGTGYASFNPYDGNERIYNARTGELLMEAAPDEYIYYLHGTIFYSNTYIDDRNLITLYDLDSGKSVTIEDANYVLDPRMFEFNYGSDSVLYYNGIPCIGVHIWKYDESLPNYGVSSYAFYDDALNLIDRLENTEVGTLSDLITGENHLYLGPSGSATYDYYLSDGTVLGKYGYNTTLRFLNGYAQVTDDFSAKLYDPSGKEVFCLPLLSMMDD